MYPLGFVYLWSLKGCTKRQQNQSSATAHGLTTRSAGRAWRSVSRRFFSVSCRRVLCFGSIHPAPSHFVSVNSASSSGLPTPPSPLGEPAWNTTVDRTIYRLTTDLSKLTFRGIQKHDVSPPPQPDYHCAFSRATVGRKEPGCIRLDTGQEEDRRESSAVRNFICCMSLYFCHECIHFGKSNYGRRLHGM